MRSRTCTLLFLAVIMLLGTVSDALAHSRRRSSTRLEEIEGVVVGLSGDSLTIRTHHRGDRDVRVVSSTEVIIDDRRATLSLVRVGDKVEAIVRKESDSTYTVVRLEVEEDDARVELEGTVRSVSATVLIIRTDRRDVQIALTAQTSVLVNGHSVPASAITVGARVQVDAQRRSDGTYEALVVKLNSRIVEIEGVITAVSGSSIAVRTGGGRTVVVEVTPATIVRVDDHSAALLPGMRVEIDAVRNTDGSLMALRIEGEDEQDLVEIEAVVTVIGDGSIRVRTRAGEELTIIVPPDVIIRADEHLVPLSMLKVGDRVEIDARRDGNTLTAVRIEIEEAEEDELDEVEGVITAISGSMLAVRTEHGEVTVFVTSTTVIRRDDDVVPLSALQLGDEVEVKGHRNADGSLQAVVIEIAEDDDEHGDTVEIKGSITAVTESSVTILTRSGTSITVAITEATLIKRDDHRVTPADLRVGQRVEIKAKRNSDGSFVALSIEIEEEDDD